MADDKEGIGNLSHDRFLEIQFIQYISLLANSAMEHLGKLMNPMTGKIERNLEAAKATIDLIAMLKEKTKGNLSESENQVISSALANLQLNYVDEISRAGKEPPGEKKN
jgi:hypothetical protein